MTVDSHLPRFKIFLHDFGVLRSDLRAGLRRRAGVLAGVDSCCSDALVKSKSF